MASISSGLPIQTPHSPHTSFAEPVDPKPPSKISSLREHFQVLVQEGEEGHLSLGEMLDYLDALNRSLSSVEMNQDYLDLIDEIEALETRDGAHLFNHDGRFSYKDKEYVIRPTKGEGSCALHALLGEDVEGIYRFPGEKLSSSAQVKELYADALQSALTGRKENTREFFYDVLSGYLQLSEDDPSAKMLFEDSAEGRKIQEHWTEIQESHARAINKINEEEAAFWHPLIEDPTTKILDKIMEEVGNVTDPTSQYFKKNPEDVLQLFQGQPIRILDKANPEFITDAGAKETILKLREKKAALQEEQDLEKFAFILSKECVDHYVETIKVPAFFLETNEIKLAAHLFHKHVVIVASNASGIEPTEEISGPASSDKPIIIHHQGAHFSRCVKAKREAESPLFSSLPLDRDTRSNTYSPGPMRVISFDHKTGSMGVEFTSHEQYARYQEFLSQSMSALGHYGMARHFGSKMRSIPSLTSRQRALEETARQIRLERGEEWRAATSEANASGIDKSIQQQKRSFEQVVAELKGVLSPKQFDYEKFMAAFEEARRLNPKSFIPYQYCLVLVASLSRIYPNLANKIVSDAYALSPQLTFNYLVFNLEVFSGFLEDEKIDRLQSFAQIFYRFFPHDSVGNILANSIEEKRGVALVPNAKVAEQSSRKAFADLLGQGLLAFHEGNFDLAREKFSEAELYHISDKRPYFYKALIDLKNGDIGSAIQLYMITHKLIDWTDPSSKVCLETNVPSSQSFNGYLEVAVLKKTIPFFNSPKKESAKREFVEEMRNYLLHPKADILWASAVLDIGKDLFGRLDKDYFNLLMTILFVSYKQLEHLDEDLSDYKGLINIKDQESPHFRLAFILTFPEPAPLKITIDPSSFELTPDSTLLLLKQVLWQRYNDLCLSIIHNIGDLDNVLTSDLSDSGSPLNGSFLSALINRIDEQGSIEEKSKFLKWALAHAKIWPPSHVQIMNDYVMRWQLERWAPSKKMHRLIQLGEEWLQAFPPQAEFGPLEMAKRALAQLKVKQYAQAEALMKPFFHNWEEQLFAGIDTDAVRHLCAIQALLQNKDLMQAMPTTSKSSCHEEVSQSALAILAREAIQYPLVIPDVEMTEKAIQTLCRLYIGRQRNESDLNFTKRLKEAHLPNTGALHHVTKVTAADDSALQNWLFPIKRMQLLNQVRAFVERETSLFEASSAHNKQIQDEKPVYTDDATFIQWVEDHPDLIKDFIEDAQQVIGAFKKTFPRFPKKAEFIAELEKKAEHLRAFMTLEKSTPKALEDPDKRFWQIVQQTADLIERMHSGRRSEVSYDMILQNEAEARFCMELINEWSKGAWQGEVDEEFATAFHGPETHIWGNGPRIPHFNAGVCIKGNLVNVHLFYLS